MKYLKCTQSYKLFFADINEINIKCFGNFYFSSNRDDRVSMWGVVFFVGNVFINWKAFKHKCVSLYTMESEYISLTEVSKQIMQIKCMLDEGFDLGF